MERGKGRGKGREDGRGRRQRQRKRQRKRNRKRKTQRERKRIRQRQSLGVVNRVTLTPYLFLSCLVLQFPVLGLQYPFYFRICLSFVCLVRVWCGFASSLCSFWSSGLFVFGFLLGLVRGLVSNLCFSHIYLVLGSISLLWFASVTSCFCCCSVLRPQFRKAKNGKRCRSAETAQSPNQGGTSNDGTTPAS